MPEDAADHHRPNPLLNEESRWMRYHELLMIFVYSSSCDSYSYWEPHLEKMMIMETMMHWHLVHLTMIWGPQMENYSEMKSGSRMVRQME